MGTVTLVLGLLKSALDLVLGRSNAANTKEMKENQQKKDEQAARDREEADVILAAKGDKDAMERVRKAQAE